MGSKLGPIGRSLVDVDRALESAEFKLRMARKKWSELVDDLSDVICDDVKIRSWLSRMEELSREIDRECHESKDACDSAIGAKGGLLKVLQSKAQTIE